MESSVRFQLIIILCKLCGSFNKPACYYIGGYCVSNIFYDTNSYYLYIYVFLLCFVKASQKYNSSSKNNFDCFIRD